MRKKAKIKRDVKNMRSIKKKYIIGLFFLFLVIFPLYISISNNNTIKEEIKDDNYEIYSSYIWGYINLTNREINNSRYHINSEITIEGRLYHKFITDDYSGFTVFLQIDGINRTEYRNITQTGGYFRISNYSFPDTINVYSVHTIKAIVENPNDTVENFQFFTLYANMNSSFQNVQIDDSIPYLTMESIPISGNLIYENTTGIVGKLIDANWTDNSGNPVTVDYYLKTDPNAIPNYIQVPEDPDSFDNMTLELSYSDTPEVGYSSWIIPNIWVFQNVTFVGLSTNPGDAGSTYTITGQAISNSSSSFPIFNRTVRVVYNFGEVTSTAQTLDNGSFTISFTIPSGHNGSYSYYVELVNSAGKSIISQTRVISINPLSTPTGTGPEAPAPFALFLIFFIPIVSVVAGILILYGYYFLKKQREDSQVSHIPLEGKISNLKILKESGRMEESLSYLFNAIFITLIDAKFGRKKKDFETIRDFAIISVKELKLKPSIIYPFITKVEEIIYSRPFEITDKDFHTVVDLFSRVYFELTNYNFILKF